MGQERPRRPDESVIAWALDTDRITAVEAQRWREKLANSRNAKVTEEVLETVANSFPAGTRYEAIGPPASAVPGSVSAAAAVVPAGRRPTGRVAAASAGDPAGHYALNPLLADAQLRFPADYAAAMEIDPNPPTLFAAGDLPPMMASGADPVLLSRVPWYARHSLASADAQTFQAEYEVLASADGVGEAQDPRYLRHANNEAYEARVVAWLAAGSRWREETRSEASRRRAEEVRAAEAEAMGDQSTWTDEQIFAAAYGPLIAKKAAEAEERMRAAQDPYRDLGPLGYKW